MQVSSASIMTNFIEFKDEIFKKLRLLENKIMGDVVAKHNTITEKFEEVEEKITSITENSKTLLEQVTDQRLQLDNLMELKKFKSKADQFMTAHDISLKNLGLEVERVKSRCDQIITQHLQVPRQIGPACPFKNLSEYILNNISELSKLKIAKDKINMESSEIKKNIENMSKSTQTLIDTSVFGCQKYTDSKHQEIQSFIERELNELNQKNIEIKALINGNKIDIEKQTDILKNDINQLTEIENEYKNITGQKIEELTKKIEDFQNEIEFLKKSYEDLKNINQSYINNKSNEEGESNINFNYTKKSKYMSKKNFRQVNNEPNNMNGEKKSSIFGEQSNILDGNDPKKHNPYNISEDYYNYEQMVPKHISEAKTINVNKNDEDKTIGGNNKIQGQKKKNTFPLLVQDNHTNFENIRINLSKIKQSANSTNLDSYEIQKILSNSLNNINDFKIKKEIEKIVISKQGINNKDIDNKICITPREDENENKNEKRNFILFNNDKKRQEREELKLFFSQRKERQEQKSQEKAVDCNIINLNIKKPIKPLKYKNDSNKNSLNNIKETKNKNNLNESNSKLLPTFGKTAYGIFNKKDINYDYNGLNGLLNKRKKLLKENLLNKA